MPSPSVVVLGMGHEVEALAVECTGYWLTS